jgi:hypothetical protein
VVFKPNKPRNKPIATSLTNGDVIKNAKVTPSGMPPFTNPMNNGTDEQEQKGVTTPKRLAERYSKPYSLFLDK